MPNQKFGTQKAVRGLSRVSSASDSSIITNPNNRFDLRSLSTALFGSTPPSDDDSPLSSASSTHHSTNKPSPTSTLPPSYATIFPPSPPLSATSSPIGTPSGSDDDGEKRLFASLDDDTSLTLLNKVFPKESPVHDLPATTIALDDLVPTFEGAVVNNHVAGTRTLYVGGGDYEQFDLRETICGVLERAEEDLGCTGVVLALDKSTPDLGGLLHSLMYVGGVIATGPFLHNEGFLLVGLDL